MREVNQVILVFEMRGRITGGSIGIERSCMNKMNDVFCFKCIAPGAQSLMKSAWLLYLISDNALLAALDVSEVARA